MGVMREFWGDEDSRRRPLEGRDLGNVRSGWGVAKDWVSDMVETERGREAERSSAAVKTTRRRTVITEERGPMGWEEVSRETTESGVKGGRKKRRGSGDFFDS